MKKIGLRVMKLICAAAFLLSGCDNVKSGGVTDHSDYNAPKVIKSDELVLFETQFFRASDIFYEVNRKYHFTMENENGLYQISEEINHITCETDPSFANQLQQLISHYDLVQHNGIHKKTAGLAPECEPYWLEAKYASDEKLSFYMDGNPYAKWTEAVLDLFAKEFSNHGIDDLLPPIENRTIKSFKFMYSFDDTKTTYSEIYMNDGSKKVYKDVWDKEGKNRIQDRILVDITDDFYKDLQLVIENASIKSFANGEQVPYDFDKDTAEYYEFHFEYESGNFMYGFSDDSNQCEQFKSVVNELTHYFEQYIYKNRKVE